LAAGGKLHTIEANPELQHISQKYFEKTGLQAHIQQHIGDAKSILPTLHENFDLIFIDAAKQDYALYYDLVFGSLNTGGLLLADNVLWDGKVTTKANDKDTECMKDFNRKLLADERVETLMLPVRDGILLAKKL
jgi:predicted O-methyltransferase YrrM